MIYILVILPIIIHLILWLKEKLIYELYFKTRFKRDKDFFKHVELMAWSLAQKKRDFMKICFISFVLFIYLLLI